ITANNNIIHTQMTLSKVIYKGELATIGTVIDITPRVKALENLKVSEGILKEAQTLTNTGTFTINRESKNIFCSTQLQNLFGIVPDQSSSLKSITAFSQIVISDDRKNFTDTINNAVKSGDFSSTTFRRFNPNGVLKYYQLKCQLLLDGSLILGTVQDISEYKLFEKRIHKQEKDTESIFNSLPFEVAILNPDLTYQFVNKHAIKDPVKRKEIIGLTALDYFKKQGKNLELANTRIKRIKEAISKKEVTSFIEVINNNGVKKVLLRTIHPIFENNELSRLVGTSTDITNEKIVEQNLEFRVKFEKLLIQLSNNLINVSIDDVDNVIGQALEKIGKLVKADRVYIFKYSQNKQLASNTHEWCSDNTHPFILKLQNINISGYKHLEASLAKGEIYKVDDVKLLPDFAEAERHEFANEGIQSLIVAPLL
ncbi:MAG: PAS domain-containing protein, partial [Bacteroidia bacterium]